MWYKYIVKDILTFEELQKIIKQDPIVAAIAEHRLTIIKELYKLIRSIKKQPFLTFKSPAKRSKI